MKIGVYVCHCGVNIAATVDMEEVTKFASSLPNVAVARDYRFMCSEPGQALIREDVKELGLDRIVVAACSPSMHELTFRGTIQGAGLNPYLLEIANIREQCSWVHDDRGEATQKAMDLVAIAVAKARLLEPLTEREVKVTPAALVIGGGIAGMQASLDIADAGFKVYLVEKEPSIGGRMAQLDKTFPTLDCSSCILTPKMVDAAHHPNIELLTYSEITSVEGFVGNFKVKVRKKPRYVDAEKCTGCNLCAEACRLKGRIPSEFDAGMGKRSAIYIPFPQAVPLVATVDPEHCIFIQHGVCGKRYPWPCIEACPVPDAIDFEQKEEILEFEVGAIIVATGFDTFDPKLKPEFGYGKYENVITSLEFERLSSASGPTGGEISINGRKPKEVVFIHCVGSRDKGLGNEYCSRICCMYTAKQAHLVKEKLPDARVTAFYTDVRAFGKGYEEFYDRVRGEGVLYRRGNASEVYKRGDKLVVRAEDTLLGKAVEVETDLVVLAVGLVPRADGGEIAGLLRLSRSPDGFFLEAHPKLRPVETAIDGVFLAGCCQGPKDIPDSVAQAKAAASSAMVLMVQGKVTIEPFVAEVMDMRCTGCGLCAEVCPFEAIEMVERRPFQVKAEVNPILCKGCGLCVAACREKAISLYGFSDQQLLAQIGAISGA